MRLITLTRKGKTEIKIWEDIDEAPIENFNMLNEYSMLAMEIGNTPADVNRRLERLSLFIAHKKLSEISQEHRNLYQTFYNMCLGVNFDALQFACMIYSINGQELTDYSQENLTNKINWLSRRGLTVGIMKEAIQSLKKKWRTN